MSKSNFSAQGLEAYASLDKLALFLRIGIGSVFVIGGWNKLYQLLSSSMHEKIVASYTGTSGYINQFFTDWMFGADALFTQWGFLTALSAFELLSGIALLVGFMVRPLSIIYGLLDVDLCGFLAGHHHPGSRICRKKPIWPQPYSCKSATLRCLA